MKNALLRTLLFLSAIFIYNAAIAQEFTYQDTLRGSITPERAWWDLTHYHLSLEVVIKD